MDKKHQPHNSVSEVFGGRISVTRSFSGAILSAALLVFTGCGGFFSKKNVTDTYEELIPLFKPEQKLETLKEGGNAVNLLAPLVQPKSCEEARTRLTQLMIEDLKSGFERQFKNHQSSLKWAGKPTANTTTESVSSASKADAAAPAQSAAPTDFTTTNNQIAGVEEGDFIKNTGTHFFLAQHDKLHIMQSWPAAEMKLLSSLDLQDKALEMVFSGKDRLVIAALPKLKQVEAVPADSGAASESAPNGRAMISSYRPSFSYNSVSLITVDISDLTAPKLVDRKVFHGQYKTFRSIGSAVRMVLNQYYSYPTGVVAYVSPYRERRVLTKDEYRNALEEQFEKNKQLLENMSLDQLFGVSTSWYGSTETLVDGSGLVPVAAADGTCANIYIPQLPARSWGISKIVTLNPAAQGRVSQSIVMGNSEIVYASEKSLYLSAQSYDWWYDLEKPLPAGKIMNYTTIHRFDLSKEDTVGYLGSGIVEGSALNQFSFDEHNDVLRVATNVLKSEQQTDQAMWWNWNTKQVNRVTTLGLENAELKVLGQTPDLAEGERIYSARFAQDRGFIVTFRQVDPLFAINLSDPRNPVVEGELKIPGFSNYMQFIDRNSILTVGQDADPNSGRTLGLKISLFDVSDMKNLRELHSHVLNQEGWATSEAQYDHKAFTYFSKKGILAIPVSNYRFAGNGYRYENSLQLFAIGKDKGIVPTGDLDLTSEQSEKIKTESWVPAYMRIRRSIFADDFVYAISQAGIKAARLDSLTSAVSYLDLPCQRGCSAANWWW